MKLNVYDYGGPDRTLALAPNGARVYFPADKFYTAPTDGWKISKCIEIYGDDPGVFGQDSGSVIKASDPDAPVFDILPSARGVHINNLQIRYDGTSTGTGVGIRCRTTQSNEKAYDVRLERLYLKGFPSHGIHLEGYDAINAYIEGGSVTDCMVKGCGGAGIMLVNVLDAQLFSSVFADNQKNGCAAIASALALYGCDFEGNCLLQSWSPTSNPNEGNVKLDACPIATVDACRVAGFDAGYIKKGVVLVGCGGASVRMGNFSTGSASSGAIGIAIVGGGPVAIIGNRFKDVPVLLDVDSNVRNLVLLPQYDETGAGTMSIPTAPNNGMFGWPQVNSGPPAGGAGMPLVIPSGVGQDYASLKPGTLFYDQAAEELRVYVPGALKAVLTTT